MSAAVPILLLSALPAFSQDIEPRRWSHLPIGSNFAGAAYAYSTGDIVLNPTVGFKLAYIGTRTQEDTGSDTDTFSVAVSMMW